MYLLYAYLCLVSCSSDQHVTANVVVKLQKPAWIVCIRPCSLSNTLTLLQWFEGHWFDLTPPTWTILKRPAVASPVVFSCSLGEVFSGFNGLFPSICLNGECSLRGRRTRLYSKAMLNTSVGWHRWVYCYYLQALTRKLRVWWVI